MAGWDRFLTERDRMVLEVYGKRRPNGLGTRPALLIVDDLYYAVGTEREPILESIKRWPQSCGLEGWAAIDRTVELLASARAHRVPVIHAHGVADFPSPLRSWKAREARRYSLDHLPEADRSRANEIVAELAPVDGELVVDRPNPSVFAGSPLLFHLNHLGIDTIIVCGETTSGCVRATVVDAATHRFWVGVVEDCCFDRTEAAHWMNLFDMHTKYADVIPLQSATAYLASCSRGT